MLRRTLASSVILCLAGCSASGPSPHDTDTKPNRTTLATDYPGPTRTTSITEYPTPNPGYTVLDAASCPLFVALSRAQPKIHQRIERACAPTSHGGVSIVPERLLRSIHLHTSAR